MNANPMQLTNHERCENCYFWHRDTTTCRRHAPEPLLEMFRVDETAVSRPVSAWPITSQFDWCGDFAHTTNYPARQRQPEAAKALAHG